MFTQKCFIRKNTPELINKLQDLGYIILFSARYNYGIHLYCMKNLVLGVDSAINEEEGFINCEENEPLFLAIAALRDDTDENQWLVDPCGYWHFNPIYLDGFRKATVPELIKHFNK